ncbi:MAG: hypothetical protein JKY19_12445 [Alcanivoracaceae bacterium]|nr:hypothetical protein [Alcanivoracaceae bacterium]
MKFEEFEKIMRLHNQIYVNNVTSRVSNSTIEQMKWLELPRYILEAANEDVPDEVKDIFNEELIDSQTLNAEEEKGLSNNVEVFQKNASISDFEESMLRSNDEYNKKQAAKHTASTKRLIEAGKKYPSARESIIASRSITDKVLDWASSKIDIFVDSLVKNIVDIVSKAIENIVNTFVDVGTHIVNTFTSLFEISTKIVSTFGVNSKSLYTFKQIEIENIDPVYTMRVNGYGIVDLVIAANDKPCLAVIRHPIINEGCILSVTYQSVGMNYQITSLEPNILGIYAKTDGVAYLTI